MTCHSHLSRGLIIINGRSLYCGALVAHEDADSFKWVFTRFLGAMGGKEPKYIITDQDAGILKAVPLVFKTARHRYCMWHIMNKVPSKYGMARDDYSVFLKKLNAIIWDEDIEPAEFDAKWEEIGREHNVNNIDWFQEMYAKRRQWVMAHCRDLDMGGVMRTTQRSESENSFFKRFESKSGTLVEFTMRFDSAMDQQRHTQKQIDNCNRHSFPEISTHLAIEVHGAEVYSHKVFEEFKEEAKWSIGTCKSRGFTECGSLEVTTVRDASRERNYEVTYCPDTLKATCSCRMLERKGIICRHVIWIYSSNGVKIIPEQCIVKRWCKDARLSKMFDSNGEATEDIDIIDGKQIAMSVMWSEIHQTVGLLMGKLKNDVENFSCLIRQFKEKLSPLGSPLNKRQRLEKILGCSPYRGDNHFAAQEIQEQRERKENVVEEGKSDCFGKEAKTYV
ncbi:protein FAR-RED IMPAIRED RESPONSE 1-like [Silene latifolia]|uniref:protein FAR-RED IMPAIRED RESPONSE 1-like n=1 Tax=Silene latifolia TaxID=37657 RepID=UPI003D775736